MKARNETPKKDIKSHKELINIVDLVFKKLGMNSKEIIMKQSEEIKLNKIKTELAEIRKEHENLKKSGKVSLNDLYPHYKKWQRISDMLERKYLG